MKKIRFRLNFALVIAGILCWTPVFGQTLTVGPGEDYQSIQSAVDAAAAWDEIVVTPGVYKENVDVDKPLSLRKDYMAGEVVVIAETPNDHVFEILSDDVMIEGFTIYGAIQDSCGIFINNHRYCMIMNNTCGISESQTNLIGIMLVDAAENYLSCNTLIGNQVGIGLSKSESGVGSTYNTIVGNNCSQNVSGAIVISESSDNYLDTNVCSNNTGPGIALYLAANNYITWNESMNNQIGISADGANNIITDNTCNGNLYGITLGGNAQSNAVVFNLSENNTIGILTLGAVDNRIYLNTFQQNSYLNALSWSAANQWVSTDPITYYYDGQAYQHHLGNYFGDHDVTDANHDAIADLPYTIQQDGSNDDRPLIVPHSEYDLIYPAEY